MTQTMPGKMVAVVGLKGGCTKTTISTNLAVELGAALVDLDERQPHSIMWAETRRATIEEHAGRRTKQARLTPVEAFTPDRFAGCGEPTLVVVDCPPSKGISKIWSRLADLTVIPSRVSAADLSSQLEAYRACEGRVVWVLSDVRSPAEHKRAQAYLKKQGIAVVATIPSRVGVMRAFEAGMSATEYLRPSDAASVAFRGLAVKVARLLKLKARS